MDVDKLNTKFRLLLQWAGVNPTQNPELIIRMYENAINWNIASQLILSGAPATLDEWMTKASQIDRAYKRSNRLFAGASSFKKKGNNQQKPKGFYGDSSNNWNQSMGEPMDIDRLSPQENERRKKEKLCFDCRKPGHFATEHFPLPHTRETNSTKERENNLSAPSRNDSTTLISCVLPSEPWSKKTSTKKIQNTRNSSKM